MSEPTLRVRFLKDHEHIAIDGWGTSSGIKKSHRLDIPEAEANQLIAEGVCRLDGDENETQGEKDEREAQVQSMKENFPVLKKPVMPNITSIQQISNARRKARGLPPKYPQVREASEVFIPPEAELVIPESPNVPMMEGPEITPPEVEIELVE